MIVLIPDHCLLFTLLSLKMFLRIAKMFLVIEEFCYTPQNIGLSEVLVLHLDMVLKRYIERTDCVFFKP